MQSKHSTASTRPRITAQPARAPGSLAALCHRARADVGGLVVLAVELVPRDPQVVVPKGPPVEVLPVLVAAVQPREVAAVCGAQLRAGGGEGLGG